MKIKNYILKALGFFCFIGLFPISTTLLSCGGSYKNEQKVKPVFFIDIKCGDNLEALLADGLVEHTGGETVWLQYEWKLTDSYITTLFPRAGVVFDNDNIIQEIHLTSTNLNEYNPHDDTKEAFNIMMQHFCQEYSGMRSKELYETYNHCIYNTGTEYYWDTPDIHIRLRHFTKSHNENLCNPAPLPTCVNYLLAGGSYTEVIITRK